MINLWFRLHIGMANLTKWDVKNNNLGCESLQNGRVLLLHFGWFRIANQAADLLFVFKG